MFYLTDCEPEPTTAGGSPVVLLHSTARAILWQYTLKNSETYISIFFQTTLSIMIIIKHLCHFSQTNFPVISRDFQCKSEKEDAGADVPI